MEYVQYGKDAGLDVGVRDAVSVPYETVAVTEYVPPVVGVPAITPVPDASTRPTGKPVAV